MMCPGRHLAQVTMSKFLTTFFLDYDVELETPEKEWKLLSAIIVKPHSWRAIVKRRLPVQEEKEISAVTY